MGHLRPSIAKDMSLEKPLTLKVQHKIIYSNSVYGNNETNKASVIHTDTC